MSLTSYCPMKMGSSLYIKDIMIKYLLMISFKENQNLNKDYSLKKKKKTQMSSPFLTSPWPVAFKLVSGSQSLV